MKIALFANTDWYLHNYRLPLGKALRERGNEVVLLSPDGPYGALLEAEGFRWQVFPLSRRGQNPFFELLTIFRLARFYRREKLDAVHHFTVKCVLYGSLAARLAGIKKVINAVPGLGYVFIDQSLRTRLLRILVKVFYRLALQGTWVIFQNPDDRAFFVRERLVQPGRDLLIRGSGVDMNRFTPLPEPAGVPVVVLPARMLWSKGVSEFVSAACLLQQQGVAVRMALVGDSDPDNPGSAPREQLSAWQSEGVVEWWGWREDMLAVMAEAHVICLPSYYGEGVPRSLVEAAACGRPAIATDMPGCREIVRNGQNGLLVPAQDAPALAEALRSLVENAPLRQQMGACGREIALAEFSLAHVLSETLKLYVEDGKG